MELQENKDENHRRKLYGKNPRERTHMERTQGEKVPINSRLKPFKSEVKGKHSAGKEFQSLAVRGKKLLT